MTTRGMIVRVLALALLAAPLAAQTCNPTEAAKLLASDGVAGDFFGTSVAISGDVAVVGAPQLSNETGAAYVYRFDGAAWVQEAKLLPSDGQDGAQFGYSVAISGDTVVVGAPSYANGVYLFAGAAYVYRYDGSGWVEEGKLLASDASYNDNLGWSVSIDGDVVLAGAQHKAGKGAAYVFRRDGGSWAQEAKLLASDGGSNFYFGYSVSISGDGAVVGAEYAAAHGKRPGAAYVYRLDGSAWAQQTKLTASDGGESDYFGGSVGMDGDTIVVGSPNNHANGFRDGSAYVFRYDGAAWQEEAKLVAADGGDGDLLGLSVGISGDNIVAGAVYHQVNGVMTGAAYGFQFDGAEWVERSELAASDGEALDLFGFAVGVSGETAIVASYLDADNGTSSGSAYLFDLNCRCAADLNGDGAVNTQDFIFYLNAWANGDPVADWNGDGSINTQDFIAYLNDWAAGC